MTALWSLPSWTEGGRSPVWPVFKGLNLCFLLFVFAQILIHLSLFGGETPRQPVTGWMLLATGKAVEEGRGEGTPVLGLENAGGCLERAAQTRLVPYWCLPDCTARGDRRIDKYRVKHSECQLHPSLFRSQDLAGCTSPKLEPLFLS